MGVSLLRTAQSLLTGRTILCTDPGIFAEGGQVQLPENSPDVFCFFLVLNLFTVLQRVSNGYFKEN